MTPYTRTVSLILLVLLLLMLSGVASGAVWDDHFSVGADQYQYLPSADNHWDWNTTIAKLVNNATSVVSTQDMVTFKGNSSGNVNFSFDFVPTEYCSVGCGMSTPPVGTCIWAFGFVFFSQDDADVYAGNKYFVWYYKHGTIASNTSQVILYSTINNVYTPIQTATVENIKDGAEYHTDIIVSDGNIKVRLNNTEVINSVNTSFTYGVSGFYNEPNKVQKVNIDNFYISSYEPLCTTGGNFQDTFVTNSSICYYGAKSIYSWDTALGLLNATNPAGTTISVQYDNPYSKAVISADMKIAQNATNGYGFAYMVFGEQNRLQKNAATNSGNHYLVYFGNKSGAVQGIYLDKTVSNVQTSLASKSTNFNKGDYYNITVLYDPANTTSIIVLANGTQMLTSTDKTFTSGYIGFVGYPVGGIYHFDNLRITDISSSSSTPSPSIFNWYCPAGRFCLGPFVLWEPAQMVMASG